MDKITIRDATVNDIPELMTFMDDQLKKDWFLAKGRWKRYITGVDWNRNKKSHTPHLVRVAEVDGKIAGVYIKSHTGKLFNLMVRRDMRKSGVGKALMLDAKPKVVRCKTDMHAGNPSEFYKKLGFVKKIGTEGKNDQIDLLTQEHEDVRWKGRQLKFWK